MAIRSVDRSSWLIFLSSSQNVPCLNPTSIQQLNIAKAKLFTNSENVYPFSHFVQGWNKITLQTNQTCWFTVGSKWASTAESWTEVIWCQTINVFKTENKQVSKYVGFLPF